jgi:hypothetical protein
VSGVYWPRPVTVEHGADGVPRSVGAVSVETVREEWLVEDRWWTPEPLCRRYFELALADGRCMVVFREPGDFGPSHKVSRQQQVKRAESAASNSSGHWFEQRA